MIRSLTRLEARNRRLLLALLTRAAASRAAARACGIVFRDQLKFHFAAEQAAMGPQVRAKLTSEPHGQALLDADPAAACAGRRRGPQAARHLLAGAGR
jgi:hypothetical protein